MTADLLSRKRTRSLLPRPAVTDPQPRALLGTLLDGAAPSPAELSRSAPRIGAGNG